MSRSEQTHGSWCRRRMPDMASSRRVRVAPPECVGMITYRLCRSGMQRRRSDTIQCVFRSIKRVHATPHTSTRPRPTHISHVRDGALTIHHLDWMDRHPSGPGRTPRYTGARAVRPWVDHRTSTSTSQCVHAQHNRCCFTSEHNIGSLV